MMSPRKKKQIWRREGASAPTAIRKTLAIRSKYFGRRHPLAKGMGFSLGKSHCILGIHDKSLFMDRKCLSK